MSFERKKIDDIIEYDSILDLLKKFFLGGGIVKLFLIGIVFAVVIKTGIRAFGFSKTIVKNISWKTAQSVSRNFGADLEKGQFGNINGLIIGYGGEGHQGAYLADSIMVASFDESLGSVSFLSIPRDLYIREGDYSGKINGYLAHLYYKTGSLSVAVEKFKQKIEKITDTDIPYYSVVNFDGFKDFIDTMGGITIDVPKRIYDPKYPDGNWGYTTFQVDKGKQRFDGEKALKYARSRHSTSDFSRSRRQQQIIKAMIDEIFSGGNLFDVNYIKKLYGKYKEFVTINLSFKEVLGLVQYVDSLNNFSTSVYTAECQRNSYKNMKKGCMLYYPPQENFGGLSVLLPVGGTYQNPGVYKKLQNFAFMVLNNQGYLLENAEIHVENGVSLKTLRKEYGWAKRIANDFSIKLKKYGFNVQKIDNADKNYTGTVVYKNTKKDMQDTIDMIEIFTPVQKVLTGNIEKYDNDLTLILGKDYVK